MILNFQDFTRSEAKSQTRLAAAESALGKRTVERIMAFSSYLSGAKRDHIARVFNYTVPGLNSFIQRLYQQGSEAFSRTQGPGSASPSLLPELKPVAPIPPAKALEVEVENHVMNLKVKAPTTIQIPFEPTRPSDQLVVLKCQSAGLLTIQQVADFLNKTPNQIQHLRRKMKATEGIDLFSDLRGGQPKPYKFTEKAQAELLYYFFEDLVAFRSISSIRIHEKLEKALSLGVSDRTVRTHLDALILPEIKARLLELVKKTPSARG
ncbi:MAG: hypothetical protein ACE5HO_20540 [bacterium]